MLSVLATDLGAFARSEVHKLADGQITVGVSDLGTTTPTGSNEKAFHIIKVICVAIDNLVWAVETDKGIFTHFQLLTSHTCRN